MERIYFDNASTTPLLPEVKEAMIGVINNNFGNPSSIHKFGRESKIIIEDARKTIAKGLGASTGEIFFTSGATESNNMALLCSIRDLGVKRVISTKIEHHCILHTLDYIEENKLAEVIYLDVDSNGHIDYQALKNVLDASNDKALVTLMHVNNEIGTIHDLEKLSDVVVGSGHLFHCDTAQSIGKIKIDLSQTKVSFICGAAHKFFGPKGTGFVYINNDNNIKSMFHGGSQERGVRSGTENIYGITGMAKAFELALQEFDLRKAQISKVKNHFIDQLKAQIDDFSINGNPESSLYNILSVSFPKTNKMDMVMMNLDMKGISASAGSACTSGVENESHVLEGIGHDPKRKTVRFSFSHFNTVEEVDYTVACLKALCAPKTVHA